MKIVTAEYQISDQLEKNSHLIRGVTRAKKIRGTGPTTLLRKFVDKLVELKLHLKRYANGT